MITSARFYVPVVTLSINDNVEFLEKVQQGFEITISWNKCRSEITTQPKNNSLDYVIDQTFRNINTLFVLSFKNGDDDASRNYFDEYYMPLVEIKYFNTLIHSKPFFDQPIKNKQKAYEKIIKMSRNNDYTARKLLDFSCHQNYYKIIGIDLSKQTDICTPQQINFTENLEENDGAKIVFFFF